MKEYYLDNPVGRLYLIVEKMKKLESPNEPLSKALMRVYEIEGNNSISFYECIHETLALFQTAKDVLNKSSMDTELYENSMKNVEQSISNALANMQNSAATLSNSIAAPTLEALRHISFSLSKETKKKYIPSDKLEELKQKIAELRQFVKESDIDSQFKELLEKHFLTAEKDIILYQLFGKDFLSERVKDLISTLVLGHTQLKQNLPLKEKLFSYFEDINTLSSLYSNAAIYLPQISQMIKALLPG